MRLLAFCAFMLILLSSLASATAASKSESPSNGHGQSVTSSRPAQPTGEDVFKANCGRCHVPPMSISPRITGTVIMHMRTRARLSRQDEQLLLKYMAP